MNEENRKLEAVTFNFKQKNENSETSFDLFNEIGTEFANFVDLLPNDEPNKRSVKIEKKKEDDNSIISSFKILKKERLVYGKISSTNYGKIINIIDPQDKDAEPVYQSKPEHGLEKVFFFLIHISQENNKGFFLLERNGVYGIRTVFCSIFKRFIKDTYPENKVFFNNFIDKEILNRYINKGTTKSITLKTDRIPKELSDRLNFLEEEYKDYTISFTIKKKRGFFGSSTNKVINELYNSGNKSYLITENLKVAGFGENSEISTKVSLNGKEKNINFNDSFNLKSIYDIYVETDEFGESELNSISNQAISLFKEINPY